MKPRTDGTRVVRGRHQGALPSKRHPRSRPFLQAALSIALALSLPGLLGAGERFEYYHLDAVGNIRAVTDENGNIIERHDYLPFGDEWCGTAVCGAPTPGQPRRFTGKERDNETGFDYFGARYYSGRIGRFTTVDPVMNIRASLIEPQRWNRYAYVTNNPLRFTDPDGRDRVAEFFLGEAGVGVSTFDVIFSRQTVSGIQRGAQAFAADHEAMTGGFSPVPTGKSDIFFAAIPGGKLGKGATKAIARTQAATKRLLGTLGRAGRGKGVREVVGDAGDARKLFNNLRGSNPIDEIKPGVFTAPGANGGTVTFRATSKSGPPTVDVHGIEEGIRKIKFVDQ